MIAEIFVKISIPESINQGRNGSALVLNRKLSQNCVQLLLQSSQNLGNNSLGISIRQSAVISTQLQGEGHGLLTLGNTDTAVDVEELYTTQQLTGSGSDDVLHISNGDSLVTDQRQVTGNGRILGQGSIGGIGQQYS